jgi:hypothetical protein
VNSIRYWWADVQHVETEHGRSNIDLADDSVRLAISAVAALRHKDRRWRRGRTENRTLVTSSLAGVDMLSSSKNAAERSKERNIHPLEGCCGAVSSTYVKSKSANYNKQTNK